MMVVWSIFPFIFYGQIQPHVHSTRLEFLIMITLLSTQTCIGIGNVEPPITLIPMHSTRSFDLLYTTTEEENPPIVLGNIAHDLIARQLFPQTTLEQRQIGFFPSQQLATRYFRIDHGPDLYRQLVITRRIDRETVCETRKHFSYAMDAALNSNLRSQDRLCECSLQMQICSISMTLALLPIDESIQPITVTVQIHDKNDNSPIFTMEKHEVEFSESDPIGASKLIPSARDIDFGVNSQLFYTLTDCQDVFQLRFSPGENSLHLELKESLDRERQDSYICHITACDGGNPSKCASSTLKVIVTDDNDWSPQFDLTTLRINVTENIPIDSYLLTVSATDRDADNNGVVDYILSGEVAAHVSDMFALSKTTGELRSAREFDREKVSFFVLPIIARDRGTPKKSSTATLYVNVLDINDNPPQLRLPVRLRVKENRLPGSVVDTLQVEDPDVGPNGTAECQLTHETDNNFTLQPIAGLMPITYKLITRVAFNYEELTNHPLHILCMDGGSPMRSSNYSTIVWIEDDNDHAPLFDRNIYQITVPENSPVGRFLMTLHAVDLDASTVNNKIMYTVDDANNSYVTIGREDGRLCLNKPLDRETVDEIHCYIVATDSGEPSLRNTATVTIYVEDINDVPPMLESRYDLEVLENEPLGTLLGLFHPQDPDTGRGADVEVFLDERTSDFRILSDGRLVTNKIFDREVTTHQRVVLYARDFGIPSLTSSSILNVTILDENDNAPEFIYPSQNPANLTISFREHEGFPIAQLSARDVDTGENAKISFFVVPAQSYYSDWFHLDVKNGHLVTAREFREENIGIYVLDCIARDHGGKQSQETITRLLVQLKDLPMKWSHGSQPKMGMLSNLQNWNIVIILGIVTGLMVTFLIIAILAVHRMHTCCGQQLAWKRYERGTRKNDVTSQLNYTTSPSHVSGMAMHESTIPSHMLHSVCSSKPSRCIENFYSSSPTKLTCHEINSFDCNSLQMNCVHGSGSCSPRSGDDNSSHLDPQHNYLIDSRCFIQKNQTYSHHPHSSLCISPSSYAMKAGPSTRTSHLADESPEAPLMHNPSSALIISTVDKSTVPMSYSQHQQNSRSSLDAPSGSDSGKGTTSANSAITSDEHVQIHIGQSPFCKIDSYNSADEEIKPFQQSHLGVVLTESGRLGCITVGDADVSNEWNKTGAKEKLWFTVSPQRVCKVPPPILKNSSTDKNDSFSKSLTINETSRLLPTRTHFTCTKDALNKNHQLFSVSTPVNPMLLPECAEDESDYHRTSIV